ncbi:hypothetical protein J7K27_07650 [Candidatus Bathyarchaeota archaeon]|nr:hypothetical protein [Candidatus Bathyarchaeota archaeon]
MEVSISDSAGRTLGYKDGALLNEIPGGVIFLESTLLDVYFIVDPKDDYSYKIRSLSSGNYNMTIALIDSSGVTIEFNAKMISVEMNTQHKYVINWTLLAQGENGVTLLIDQDGDGVYERSIECGDELTHLDVAVPWWSNLWWFSLMMSIICVIIVSGIYLRYAEAEKLTEYARKTDELED